MKRNYVEIFVCLNQREKVVSLFEKLENVVYFDTYDALIEKLTLLNYGHPHIVIVDYNYLLQSENKLRSTINDELMYKGASVGIYGDTIPLNIKEQLYTLEFKGIFDAQLGYQKQILIHMIQRSNFYAATFQNNFIKGIIRFHNILEECRRSLYLLDFLVRHYKISNQDAARIRLAFVFLMLAFHEDKFFQTSKLLKTVFKSKDTSSLFQNYTIPKTFSELIISQLLLLNKSPSIQKFTRHINTTNIPVELSETVAKLAKSRAIAVSSNQDINFFWEELNILISEKNFTMDDLLEKKLNSIYEVLIDSLHHLNFFVVSIEHIGDNKLVIQLHVSEQHQDSVQKYLNTIDKIHTHVTLRTTEEEALIEIEVSQAEEISKIDADIPKCEVLSSVTETVINTSTINTMHYKDEAKISAFEFLKDFEVEQYLLDELNENESEMKNNLFLEDELNQEIVDAVVETLDRYVRVLHGTIEFEDIAFSLKSLSEFLTTLDIAALDESKKNTLRFYIYGLINDLSSWKQYIFIEPNTPDIHYLDASLLENCAEIEKFITQKDEDVVSNTDDDMEFF
ncbi:MAG: hypothetical protein RBR59_03045 [Sulfurimonadaceae bacterium]|nr:hypothetical protein [Sulfurimonadaceae bacterium]